MRNQITTAHACFLLCQGAIICVPDRICKRSYITLKFPDTDEIASIRMRQFEEIYSFFRIKLIDKQEDKYGNKYSYYIVEDFVLASARELYLKRNRERK